MSKEKEIHVLGNGDPFKEMEINQFPLIMLRSWQDTKYLFSASESNTQSVNVLMFICWDLCTHSLGNVTVLWVNNTIK